VLRGDISTVIAINPKKSFKLTAILTTVGDESS
jgi:hypothetical protein